MSDANNKLTWTKQVLGSIDIPPLAPLLCISTHYGEYLHRTDSSFHKPPSPTKSYTWLLPSVSLNDVELKCVPFFITK